MTAKKRFARFISSIVAVAVAIISIGLSPAKAADTPLGNAELQSVISASVKAMKATGIVFAVPSQSDQNIYRYVANPKRENVPVNFGVTAKLNGGIIAVMYEIAPDNALLGGNFGAFFRANTLLGSATDYVYPDKTNLTLGVRNQANQTLDSYEVTKPTSSSFLVRQQVSDYSQGETPSVVVTEVAINVAKGLMTRMLLTRSVNGEAEPVGKATYYNYSQKHIESEFAKAVNTWKKNSFAEKYQGVVSKLTKAFIDSKKAALVSGLTVTDENVAQGGYAQKGTYDPVTKKSVTLGLNSAKKVFQFGLGDATNVFGLMFTNMIGGETSRTSQVIYSGMTRTYKIISEDGTTSIVRLDSKGRIVEANLRGVFGLEKKTIKYAATESILKPWRGLATKTKRLARWVAKYNASELTQGVFTQTGSTITLAPVPYDMLPTFDVTGMKASDIARAFKLAGQVLVQG